MNIRLYLLIALATAPPSLSHAQDAGAGQSIMMINMGGNDCPPCVAWRRSELPKLQKQAAFSTIDYVHVEKTIQSSVPPRFFLPERVRPYKDKLDVASGGMSGSPQVAILVDGEVYDYIYGSRSAEDVLKAIQSIRTGATYPFERCLQRRDRLHCSVKAP